MRGCRRIKKLSFKAKSTRKGALLIALLVVGVFAAVGYAVVLEYTLSVPSTVVVVQADPSVQLIASDNTTVVTSLTFGSIVQGESGTWSGYLKNSGNDALHTFSIASPDIGSVGTVTWNIPATGDLGVGQMWPVTITLSINQTAGVGSHSFTVQITGSPTVSGPTSVVITATDPNDPYLRGWGVMFDAPLPPYATGEGFPGADVNQFHVSGDTMSFQWNLAAGAHYLVFGITQVGGPSYGVYNGTITINGIVYDFSGVDINHPVTIDFTV